MGFNVSSEKGQLTLCYMANFSDIERDKDFFFMVNCKENPLDRETLQKMIKRYPDRYSRYGNWIPKLPSRKDIENKTKGL